MENGQVITTEGIYEGVKAESVVEFRGIPYAKAPVGELRFRAPQAAEKFDGIKKADRYGNRSIQTEWNSPENFYKKEFYEDKVYATPLSEDSLYLNVWTTEEAKDWPVFFYIHGGGFTGGTGHEVEFRTHEYAKRGIVFVTVNYRLGILGFMANQWLKEEDPLACGNYGIMDQIAALKWVRENIAAFGGNPDQITICGQSAGGMSVETILASREGDGLYDKAIIQSAGGYPQFLSDGSDLGSAFQLGDYAINYLKVNSLEELRALPVEKMVEVQGAVTMETMKKGIGLPYGPVVNGTFLSDTISNQMKNGKMNVVPMMIGSTRDDITVSPEEGEAMDSKFHQSNITFSQQQESLHSNPAYVYYFTRRMPGDERGAFHSAELWYMFGTLKECWRPLTEADDVLSKEMLDYWSNFIKTGDPNGAGLEEWKPCSGEDAFVKKFDVK